MKHYKPILKLPNTVIIGKRQERIYLIEIEENLLATLHQSLIHYICKIENMRCENDPLRKKYYKRLASELRKANEIFYQELIKGSYYKKEGEENE